MIYGKNRANEKGIWFIIIITAVFGPVLFLNEPSVYGKTIGFIFSTGSIFLIIYLLIFSVQKIITHSQKMELHYYLRKKYIPYSTIDNIELVQQTYSSKGITRIIDVIDLYIYPDKKIRLGGNFGGFFKHNTKQLYNDIKSKIDIDS